MYRIGENILALRKKSGLSQEELAEKIGISRQAVSNWERGTATPDVETLGLLAKTLNVDFNVLLQGENAPKQTQDAAERPAEGRTERLAQSPTERLAEGSAKLRTILMLCNLSIFAVHLFCALRGQIYIKHILIGPALAVTVSLMIFFIFRHVIAQNDYSLIAGFDPKKDKPELVKKQLETIDLLNLICALICNILFFAAYAGEEQGRLYTALGVMGFYLLSLLVNVLCVNLKIKSRL